MISSSRLSKNHRHWFSPRIISPFEITRLIQFRPVTSDYVITKRKEKKEREKKSNKGASTRTRDETAKYCFSILLAGDDGETRCEQCFQKKYTTPTATPASGVSICIFSTPVLPPAPTVVISCSLWQTQGLQISKRKHRPKVKPNLFCAFLQSQNKAGVKL